MRRDNVVGVLELPGCCDCMATAPQRVAERKGFEVDDIRTAGNENASGAASMSMCTRVHPSVRGCRCCCR